MILKLSRIVYFLQIFADVSKKSKAVIAIYVYASESSSFAHLENDAPFGPFWSAKYLHFGGESCEIRILPRSIKET